MSKKESFKNNLNYVLDNLERSIINAEFLEDKIYLELTKKEIIDYLDYVNKIIKNWEEFYKSGNYDDIREKYKEVESIISELELCLADYKVKFNMDGISYAIFQIGNILSNN